MPRLGELLIAAGVLTDEQLEEALRAQVVWGGRLGTNLVDLGHVTLDEVAQALGRQHGLPAALGAHFTRADRDLQNTLPPEFAERFACVPLVRAGKRIVVASITALDDRSIAMVAGALDINRTMIVPSIAAELRIRFQLERIYDLPRPQRFLRSRGTTEQSQVFSLPLAGAEPGARSRAPAPALDPDEHPLLELVELPLDDEPAAAPYDPAADERRTYLRTLADMLTRHPDRDSVIARVQRTAQPVDALRIAGDSPPALPIVATSLVEATRDIIRSPDRDLLAQLTIGSVAKFLPECRSAILLVVRGEAAVSWTSFCRDGTALPPIAVPLDQPGLVPAVITRKTVARGASGDLGVIDYLVLASLGVQFGDLVVAPIAVGDHVMSMLVMAVDHRTALPQIEPITTAAAGAFTRLLRDAGR